MTDAAEPQGLALVRARAAAAPDAAAHDVADAALALLRKVDTALATGTKLSPDFLAACAPLLRSGFAPPSCDTAVEVDAAGTPLSIGTLLALLRMRVDLAMHESDWCSPDKQFHLSDLLPEDANGGDDDPLAGFLDAVAHGSDEPILFWGVRRTMALLAAAQRLWHAPEGANADLAGMVRWVSRRLALLLTFSFANEATLDVPQYRRAIDVGAETPTYEATSALLWDAAAVLRPMWRDLDRYNTVGPPPDRDAGDDYDEEPLCALVRRVVFKMHGDRLPDIYAACCVRRATRIGHQAWFQRRAAADAIAPEPLNVLRVCCGDAYAKNVHDRSMRPLAEVVAADPLEPALVETCCQYIAAQQRLKWTGGVEWVPVRCRWAARVSEGNEDARECCRSYAQAVLHFVRGKAGAWPAGVLVN